MLSRATSRVLPATSFGLCDILTLSIELQTWWAGKAEYYWASHQMSFVACVDCGTDIIQWSMLSQWSRECLLIQEVEEVQVRGIEKVYALRCMLFYVSPRAIQVDKKLCRLGVRCIASTGRLSISLTHIILAVRMQRSRVG